MSVHISVSSAIATARMWNSLLAPGIASSTPLSSSTAVSEVWSEARK